MISLLQGLWQHRASRFLVTAAICTVIQEAILFGLIHWHLNRVLADGIGFGLAAQASFVLSSSLTWGDRKLNQSKRSITTRWLTFNFVAGIVLLVNVGVFAFVVQHDKPFVRFFSSLFSVLPKHVDAAVLVASIAGILIGAVVSFNLNNLITFRQAKTIEVSLATVEPLNTQAMYGLAKQLVQGLSLAYFMPAYNEGGNLRYMVEDALVFIRSLKFSEARIIIINDGSSDDTAAVADELALRHTEVVAHHRKHNGGYGRALKTGFRAVVAARTIAGQPFDLWAFSDADRQFRVESLSSLLVAQIQSNADLVVGYRIDRQINESRFRYYLGRFWHLYSRAVVGRDLLVVRDVDCGMKLGCVNSLAIFVEKLFGEKAAISPELIARSKLAGHIIAEQPVEYLPRIAGKSTGSNPKVMLVSGFHIILVGLAIRTERRLGRTWQFAKNLERDIVHEVDIVEGLIRGGEDIATEST